MEWEHCSAEPDQGQLQFLDLTGSFERLLSKDSSPFNAVNVVLGKGESSPQIKP